MRSIVLTTSAVVKEQIEKTRLCQAYESKHPRRMDNPAAHAAAAPARRSWVWQPTLAAAWFTGRTSLSGDSATPPRHEGTRQRVANAAAAPRTGAILSRSGRKSP